MTPEESKDSSEIEISVKGPSNIKLTLSFDPSISVLELKQLITTKSEIPSEQQRLIYGGRVLKDDDKVESYNIKNGHAIHLVKGAAKPSSTPTSSSTSSSSTPSNSTSNNVPRNLGAGNAFSGNPLAPLLNATNQFQGGSPYAMMGDQMRDMQDPEYFMNMMNDPTVRAQMDAMMSDPGFVDQMISMNPQMAPFREQFRATLQSPMMRSMLTNPEAMRSAMEFSRQMRGSGGSGGGNSGGGMPAPGNFGFGSGASNTTNSNSSDPSNPNNSNNSIPPNSFAGLFNPFGSFGSPGGGGIGGEGAQNPFGGFGPFGGMMGPNPFLFGGGQYFNNNNPDSSTATSTPSSTTTSTTEASGTPAPGNPDPSPSPNPNPFGGMGNFNPQQFNEIMANLNRAMGGGGGGFGGFGPFGGMGGGMGGDTRSPEERYETQLAQLRELGFTDARMNVRALIATGGIVEAAVEYILNGGPGDVGSGGGGNQWQNMFG